jgi:hypothetical protein
MTGTMSYNPDRSACGDSPEWGRNLVFLVRRALRSNLGPPDLVRWVRNRAERYEAEGEEPGDRMYRRVANALGRALTGSADTQMFGPEQGYQTAVA